jgi:hypothetical protein
MPTEANSAPRRFCLLYLRPGTSNGALMELTGAPTSKARSADELGRTHKLRQSKAAMAALCFMPKAAGSRSNLLVVGKDDSDTPWADLGEYDA